MRVVFVDRDGVINRNRRNHVKSWEDFQFLPGSIDALAELTRYGFRTVVLTNQAAINRGLLSREELEAIHDRMVGELARAGARVDAVLYCPHRPEERCQCRKPRPGLLLAASRRLGISLAGSYLVGDAVSDLAAGMAVGCQTILVMTGRGIGQFLSPDARRRRGFWVSRDLRHAVRKILIQEGLIRAGILERVEIRLLRAA